MKETSNTLDRRVKRVTVDNAEPINQSDEHFGARLSVAYLGERYMTFSQQLTTFSMILIARCGHFGLSHSYLQYIIIGKQCNLACLM